MAWYNPFTWGSTPTPVTVVTSNPNIGFANYRDLRPECITSLTSSQQTDIQNFLACYNANKGTYTAVGLTANVPAMLVAAIHWREASGDFSSYLEQGDPIGSVTYANGDSNNGVSLPPGTPNTISFTNWNDAAVWALNQNVEGQKASGISYDEGDINDMLTYAEYYNGTGYKDRGLPSPYTLAGTSCYQKGKFTSDGTFDPNAVDTQLGVLVMLRAVIGYA